MEPVQIIAGTMAPLPQGSVDTDQIIPKQFLKRIERTGYGAFLFHDWARDATGALDPEFPLNKPEHANAVVLVAGHSFGIGSSREHAAWAIQDRGFRAVVAPSFGDIFRNNCHKIGLLPVVLTGPEVDRLLALASAAPDTEIVIDLASQTVRIGEVETGFDIDPAVKHRLLNGLDDIGLTLRIEPAITAYEARRSGWLPAL